MAVTKAHPAVTEADFARSDRFLFGSQRDICNSDIGYCWLEGGKALGYRHQSAASTDFRRIEIEDGAISPLFDHDQVAALLDDALGRVVDPRHLPIDRLCAFDNGVLVVEAAGARIRCDLAAARAVVESPPARSELASPDGKWTAFARDHDLWLADTGGQETQITHDGVLHHGYCDRPESSTSPILERRFGMVRPLDARWSPDGTMLVFHRLDERDVAELHLVQSIPDDGSMRPRLHSYRCEFPGEPGATAAHFIYDLKRQRVVAIDYRPLYASFGAPIERERVWWAADGRTVYLLDVATGDKALRLVAADAETGSARLLIDEACENTPLPQWQIAQPLSSRSLADGDIIWFSERSGWGHFYRHDGITGAVKHAITSGNWLARDIVAVDEDSGWLYVVGSGREAGDHVLSCKLYRAKLDGSCIELLTPEPGNHQFAAVRTSIPQAYHEPSAAAPDKRAFVDRASDVDRPAVWRLRRSDGALIAELAREDPASLPPFTMPEPFTVRSDDDAWDLHGVLFKPADFDPARRYPMIDAVYPGPQSSRRPTNFSGGFGSQPAIFGVAQALADLGFVVMTFDGRGTPGRSRAFRDISYGHLETAGSLIDHVAALRQLAQTRPYLDLTRVGITGISGGGYATVQAMTHHPETFSVGVAGCGNYDMRCYLGYWGETYHGPAATTDYAKAASATAVSALAGRLLIAHGEMDDNVHPAITMRLVQALVEAGKLFDMLILPNVHHILTLNGYYVRAMEVYFLRHLMHATLPSEVDMVPAGKHRETKLQLR